MNSLSACQTCQRKLVKAGALGRCEDWRRAFDTFKKYDLGWSSIEKCSDYIGPHEEAHIKIAYGPNYADSLRHGGIKK